MVALTVICAAVVGCAAVREETQVVDRSGVSESQALALSLRAQYELAGERHRDLNERFAEVQRTLFSDQWEDTLASSEVIPTLGGNRSDQLEGATHDNSYSFVAHRRHQAPGTAAEAVRSASVRWGELGWDVRLETSEVSGEVRAVATTDDGYWFAAAEEGGYVTLAGMAPVFWGDQFALLVAAAERRDAENEAGADWDAADAEGLDWVSRLPGDYRPFPEWDAR